jgi:hypothetical protein
MRQACVERVYPKATTTTWNTHLGKAHPSTFEQALPKLHALPIKDNPFLLLVQPSATSTWAKRYGCTGWGNNEAHFPPYFRAYLQSIHLICTGEKAPPKLPLLTWDEEVEACQALADEQATPLKSPAGTSNERPCKHARFDAAPATSARRIHRRLLPHGTNVGGFSHKATPGQSFQKALRSSHGPDAHRYFEGHCVGQVPGACWRKYCGREK